MMREDDDLIPQFSFFQVIPDFDGMSRNGGTCSISNLNCQREALGREESEVDRFVLRGPLVEYEGYIDIRPSVIIRTAEELGMVSGQDFDELCESFKGLRGELAAARAEAAAYQQELDVLRAAIRESFTADTLSVPSEDVLDTEYLPLPEDL